MEADTDFTVVSGLRGQQDEEHAGAHGVPDKNKALLTCEAQDIVYTGCQVQLPHLLPAVNTECLH